MRGKTKMQHKVIHSQQGLEKLSEQIKSKQRPCVKSHHMENIFIILLQNTIISEIVFSTSKLRETQDSLALRKQ